MGPILGLLAAGHSEERILEAYPFLEAKDIRAVLTYAARNLPWEGGSPRAECILEDLLDDVAGHPLRAADHVLGAAGAAEEDGAPTICRSISEQSTTSWHSRVTTSTLEIESGSKSGALVTVALKLACARVWTALLGRILNRSGYRRFFLTEVVLHLRHSAAGM